MSDRLNVLIAIPKVPMILGFCIFVGVSEMIFKNYKILWLTVFGIIGQMLSAFAEQRPEFIVAKLHQSDHIGTWIEFEYYDFWRAPFIFEASFKGADKFNICVQLDWKSLESVACFEADEREAKIKKLMLEFSDTDRRKLATLCFLLQQKSDEITKIFHLKNANDLLAAFAERQLDFQSFGDSCTKYLMNITSIKKSPPR